MKFRFEITVMVICGLFGLVVLTMGLFPKTALGYFGGYDFLFFATISVLFLGLALVAFSSMITNKIRAKAKKQEFSARGER